MKLSPLRGAFAIIALIVIGLFSLNLWLFHAWAAGGPPSPNPEWHAAWSWVFLAVGAACLCASGVLIWQRRMGLKKWVASLVGTI